MRTWFSYCWFQVVFCRFLLIFNFLPSHRYKSTVLLNILMVVTTHLTRQTYELFPTNFIRDNDDWRQRCIAVVCLCANFTLFRYFSYFFLKIKESMEVITKFKIWITSTTSTVTKGNPTSFRLGPLVRLKSCLDIPLCKGPVFCKLLYYY